MCPAAVVDEGLLFRQLIPLPLFEAKEELPDVVEAAAAELRMACVNEVTLAVEECGILLSACEEALRLRLVVELDFDVLLLIGNDVSLTILSTEYRRLFVREDTIVLLWLLPLLLDD